MDNDKAALDLFTREMRACVDAMRRGVDDLGASLNAGKSGDGTSGHELYKKYIDPRLAEPAAANAEAPFFCLLVKIGDGVPWKTVGQWVVIDGHPAHGFIVPGCLFLFTDELHLPRPDWKYRVIGVGKRIDLGDIPNG